MAPARTSQIGRPRCAIRGHRGRRLWVAIVGDRQYRGREVGRRSALNTKVRVASTQAFSSRHARLIDKQAKRLRRTRGGGDEFEMRLPEVVRGDRRGRGGGIARPSDGSARCARGDSRAGEGCARRRSHTATDTIEVSRRDGALGPTAEILALEIAGSEDRRRAVDVRQVFRSLRSRNEVSSE